MSKHHRWFGTDGIRGAFGEPPLDRQTVTTLGRCLGSHLGHRLGRASHIVLGGDTRESTPTLCRWLAAGLEASGASFSYGGVLPTPAVAYLVEQMGADAGIAVSASHNPHQDNGIKLVDAAGFKWPAAQEAELEDALRESTPPEVEDPDLTPDSSLLDRYRDHLLRALPGETPLGGLRIALDTANGAASALARDLFETLGATVALLHASPNGHNINLECGSTSPEDLIRRVSEHGDNLGIAFDGDADRALLVDDQSRLQDGDAMLYLWASTLHEEGSLQPSGIVATTMSNLGLERALKRRGIDLLRCGVGDRQVVETLKREGLALGGEQSGHLVHLGLSSTGDGLLTALQMASIVSRSGRSLSDLLRDFERFPQVLVNTSVSRKTPFEENPRIRSSARLVESALGSEGRLVLRYSGTERLARVMIEGPDQRRIEELAHSLADTIHQELS